MWVRRPKKRSNRWLWIIVSLVVVAAVAYGVVRTIGSQPKKQELDRSPAGLQLDASMDEIAATLGGALQIRDQMRSGQMDLVEARAALDSLGQDLARTATELEQAQVEPGLVQPYERVSRFAGNAAKQVGALASDATPDSLDRTEARLKAMVAAAGRIRASIAARPGNP
jgi:hypothetical protein